MGVVYKLVPEVSSFIIEQKQKDPKITCQNLAGTVFLKFGQRVSKSSVHELLKQAHVITPRPRKQPKEKFQIPIDKKEAISKALAPFVTIPVPVKIEEAAVSSVPTEEPVVLPPVELTPLSGEIFLQAVLWDLSFKPVLGVQNFADVYSMAFDQKVKSQWDYLTQLIWAVKIETTAGVFYIDPRFQGLYVKNPYQENVTASIERAAGEVADLILNNTQVLVIRANTIQDPLLLAGFCAAFENSAQASISKISLMGSKDREFVEFNSPLGYKRKFMMGVSSALDAQDPSAKDQPYDMNFNGQNLRLRLVKKDSKTILTNMISNSYEKIWETYEGRHLPASLPSLIVKNEPQEETLLGHLKNRAKALFPDDFSTEAFEEVLSCAGVQETTDHLWKVDLHPLPSFSDLECLQEAAMSINNFHIKNNKGKILRISVIS